MQNELDIVRDARRMVLASLSPNLTDMERKCRLYERLFGKSSATAQIETAMRLEMRQKLAREPHAEENRKVAQLIRLAKTFPRHPNRQSINRPARWERD